MNNQPQFITNANGDRISVILSLEDYQNLLEHIEDLEDIAERKDDEIIPLELALKEIGL